MSSCNQGLLSLPSELLHEIIRMCPQRDCCRLRATCRILRDHADPIVFRSLRFSFCEVRPHVSANRIFDLANQSSRACEFTVDVVISQIPVGICLTDKLRHLPAAVSALRNMTCFSWYIDGSEPAWLTTSLIQAVALLPKLTELNICAEEDCNVVAPLGLFSNLSKLSVNCSSHEIAPFFISEMATAIANNPQLRCLGVGYTGLLLEGFPLPTLRELFAKLSPNNTLRLEQLDITHIDATVDQVTLPHLTKLSSFHFTFYETEDLSIVRSVWTSLLVNNVKLCSVGIEGIITKETILYLSSLSGLERLIVGPIDAPPGMTQKTVKEMFFSEVLPKLGDSLQQLKLHCNQWALQTADLTPIMKCCKLRHLHVCIRDSMPVRHLLDTVAYRLPELKILRVSYPSTRSDDLSDFRPTRRHQYIEKFEMNGMVYMLERDGQHARYRRIEW